MAGSLGTRDFLDACKECGNLEDIQKSRCLKKNADQVLISIDSLVERQEVQTLLYVMS